MADFKEYTIDTAPEESIDILKNVQENFGFIPSFLGVIAESPATLKAYVTLMDIFQNTSFTPEEQQIVLLSVSVENECKFCVAAHSYIARNMVKLDGKVIDAIREGKAVESKRYNALRRFSQAVVKERGHVKGAILEDFLSAEYTQEQVFEVMTGVGLKTLSNYINHVADTSVVGVFKSEIWEPNTQKAA